MNRWWPPLAVALAVTVFQAGCRGPYDPVIPRDSTLPLQQHQQKHGISMLSKSVRDALLLVNQTAARAPGGQMQIKTTLENRFAKDDLWADIQYVFFDDQGHPVEKSEWTPTHFPPRELVLLEGNSLRGDAKTFNVQFKNLRSETGRVPSSAGWVFEWGIYFESVLPK